MLTILRWSREKIVEDRADGLIKKADYFTIFLKHAEITITTIIILLFDHYDLEAKIFNRQNRKDNAHLEYLPRDCLCP